MCTSETTNVKGEIERIENGLILAVFGAWPRGGQGLEKVSTFSAKGTSIRESTSSKPLCVKIGLGLWPPGRSGKKLSNKRSYISHIYPEAPANPIVTKFVLRADFQDVINCAKFHSNPFRVLIS